jgi:23S rRNA (guanosine2251-2'-O)-methyltransferase
MATGPRDSVTLYGHHPVREALRADPRRVEALFLERAARDRSAQLVAMARQAGVRYVHVDRDVLTRMVRTPHHQGVVARLAARTYASLDELVAGPRERSEPALFLALDQVQDPGNVGNLLRTAEALGAHGVVLPRHHAAGLTAHAAKAAAGALEHLPVARVGNLGHALDILRREGCRVIGASASAAGARPPWAVDLRGPVAIVLGSEERGLRPLVARGCDELTRIPLAGRVGSINVAAAGAALLYEALRQRREEEGGLVRGTPGPKKS